MELVEDLFTQSLKDLEKWLMKDFQMLSSFIKNYPADKKKENPAVHHQLIELLQYHDLIRQKIQHVQKLNELFEEELKAAGREAGYKKITPELFMLMIELLRFSGKEYAKVANQLSRSFKELKLSREWEDKYFRFFYSQAMELILKMEDVYMEIGQHQQRFHFELMAAQEKMQKIYQSFSMETERQIYKNIMKDHPHFREFRQPDVGPAEKEEDITGEIDLF